MRAPKRFGALSILDCWGSCRVQPISSCVLPVKGVSLAPSTNTRYQGVGAVPRRAKRERQAKLTALLAVEPFLTDEELAGRLRVSVATIRLDRLELGVPEVRQRTRSLAERATGAPVSLGVHEIVGRLEQIEIGRWAVSSLQVSPEMVLSHQGIVRGHYLFAQANSLAVGVINAPNSVTASARVRFLRPSTLGDTVIARAVVVTSRAQRHLVRVSSTVEGQLVFDGRFIISTSTVSEVQETPLSESGDPKC